MKNNQNETLVAVKTLDITRQLMSAISLYRDQQLAVERAEESRNFFRGNRGSLELELATKSLVATK